MSQLAFALNIFGAVLGSLAAGIYGYRIWLGKEKGNVATWFIALILDIAGLYLAYAAGNDQPYIQMGWCVAAFIIFMGAWARKGDWVWTRIDTAVLIICGLSVAVWLMSSVKLISLSGYLVAVYVSAVPQARDYLRDPATARKSAWVWQVSMVAIMFPLAAKLIEQKYGIEHTLLYFAFIVLNMIMAALCMRRVRVDD
jgi:hypothetical protein